ncbi:MJ0042-type zinc finger domain-containing protein, partial [Pseudomonas sp.]|uniref:MJ0042-type zinc finger domain-containing protein n=1 Tax=Pseudomonas sp. TaxID=306 RepID=UPI0028A9A3A3
MTDSFVTQCPHCQTSFRVTHHQLSVARGVVRCGHCLQVFNAAKQLLEQNRAAASRAPVVPPPAVVEPVAAPEPAVSEPPPVTKEDWAMTAQALDELDLDQELARLERRGEPTEPRADIKANALQARRDEPAADEHGDELFGTATDEPYEPHEAQASTP